MVSLGILYFLISGLFYLDHFHHIHVNFNLKIKHYAIEILEKNLRKNDVYIFYFELNNIFTENDYIDRISSEGHTPKRMHNISHLCKTEFQSIIQELLC